MYAYIFLDRAKLLLQTRNAQSSSTAHSSTGQILGGLFYKSFPRNQSSSSNKVKNFKIIVEAIEHLGGTMFVDKSLIDYEKELDSKNPSTINRNDEELKIYTRDN